MGLFSLEDFCAEVLRRPPDFGYHGDLPLFDTWALGPALRTRDTRGEEASAAALVEGRWRRSYGEPGLSSGWDIVRSRHFLVGWVEQIAFRVRGEDGKPTKQCAAAHRAYLREHGEIPGLENAEDLP